VWFDGDNVTALSTILIPFVQGPKDELGYWGGTMSYIPIAPTRDGVHNISFKIRDFAGNLAEQTHHFTIDSSPPQISLDQPAVLHTQEDSAIISGWTDRGATITIRDEDVHVDDAGQFEKVVTLTPGENIVVVKAIDWFATDEHVAANSVTVSITVVSDSLMPSIDFHPPLLANEEVLTIQGSVDDYISPLVPNDLMTLSLGIADIDVPVQSDGSFYAEVPLLVEGENNITFVLSDPAGNTVSDYRIVTRDTTLPTLTLESIPEKTTSNTIRIEGVTESDSKVTINGRFLDVESDGSFSEDVTLSWGPNLIVVESTDQAGNVQRITKVVSLEGGPAVLPWIVAILLLIVGLVIGYFFIPRRLEIEEEEELEEEELEELEELEEEIEEELEAEEVPEEVEEVEEMEVTPAEAPPPAPPIVEEVVEEPEPLEEVEEEVEVVEEIEEDPRLERLRKAYEEGKISKEVYEENLKKIKGGQ